MKTNKTQDAATQGVANSDGGVPPVTRENVGKWLKKDVASAIMILNAVHSDQDLLNHMADFMYGRFVNQKQAAERVPNE